jgi:hypothetical protein
MYVQNTLRYDNLDLDVMTGKTIRLNSASVVRMQEVAMPQAVAQFLDAFNRGDYPWITPTLNCLLTKLEAVMKSGCVIRIGLEG